MRGTDARAPPNEVALVVPDSHLFTRSQPLHALLPSTGSAEPGRTASCGSLPLVSFFENYEIPTAENLAIRKNIAR